MYGWKDRWMDVCMDGWDVWMYGWDVWMYGCTDVWMYMDVYGCIWMYMDVYGCMDVCRYVGM